MELLTNTFLGIIIIIVVSILIVMIAKLVGITEEMIDKLIGCTLIALAIIFFGFIIGLIMTYS